jgi:hypothetical protein
VAAAMSEHEHAALVDAYDLPLEVSRVRVWAAEGGVRWLEYDKTHAGPAMPISVALERFIAALSGPSAA